jgi:transcriptional regulator with XRE-family HTH domain
VATERRRLWGLNVKAGRKALGLTQTALAELVGVRQATVARWERGDMAPRDDMKVRIALALRQDVRALFPLFAQ